MTKKELRALYLQKRLSLSESDFVDLNQRLCDNFFRQIDLHNIKTLHTFLPLAKKREPDTWLIVEEVKKRFPDIHISIPRINATGVLENFYFENRSQLVSGSLGISEPRDGTPTPATAIDLVIVPLLAYDKKGQRVGYGKGHYDRFLRASRPDCIKIGISFFSPEEKIDDTFEGDERLNGVVTPDEFYGFS